MNQISFELHNNIRFSLSSAHIWVFDNNRGYYHLDNALDKAKIHISKVSKSCTKRLKTPRTGFVRTIQEGLEFLQDKPDNIAFSLICETSRGNDVLLTVLAKLDNNRISISFGDNVILIFDYTKMVATTPIKDKEHAELIRMLVPQISFKALQGVSNALADEFKSTIEDIKSKIGVSEIYIHPDVDVEYKQATYKILCCMHTIFVNVKHSFPNLINQAHNIPLVKEIHISTTVLEGREGSKVLATYQAHLSRLTVHIDLVKYKQYPEIVIYHELSHAIEKLINLIETSQVQTKGTKIKTVLSILERQRYINRMSKLYSQGEISPKQFYYLTGDSEFFARFLEMYFTRTYLPHIRAHSIVSVFPEDVPTYPKAISYLQSL